LRSVEWLVARNDSFERLTFQKAVEQRTLQGAAHRGHIGFGTDDTAENCDLKKKPFWKSHANIRFFSSDCGGVSHL
jgi:hypothetical protein